MRPRLHIGFVFLVMALLANLQLAMKRILSILSLLLFVSCNTNLTTVCYRYGNKPICSLRIPQGYKEWIISSGETEREHRYYYEDSSFFFYISDYFYNPNTENIELLGDSIYNYRFQNKQLLESLYEQYGKELLYNLPYTFELSGESSDSLCWRDILVGNISLGYVNVPINKKKFYDHCLDSYSIKAQGVVTKINRCQYKGYSFDNTFGVGSFPPDYNQITLSLSQIDLAEKILKDSIENYIHINHTNNPDIIQKNLKKYHRQYVGYLNKNHEVVVLILFHKHKRLKDLSSRVFGFRDGVDWCIDVNIHSKKIYNLKTNGSSQRR